MRIPWTREVTNSGGLRLAKNNCELLNYIYKIMRNNKDACDDRNNK